MKEDALLNYCLHLADNALILGHGNSAWTGHGPMLEQDIALSNIALDLIGQARYLYQYAAQLKGANTTEDTFAYRRDAWDFRNCLLVEQPNGDWGKTILRQCFFSIYQYGLYEQLQNSQNPTLAAIAEKALKETTYHLRWSSEWVIRLGDGTAESHGRMLKALDQLWPFTGEMLIPAAYEKELISEGIAVDPATIGDFWTNRVKNIFEQATLPFPSAQASWMQRGGKEGRHTEHLGYLLAEMQFLQRAYPDAQW